MLSTTGSIVNTQCTSLLVFDYPANFKISDEDIVKVYYIEENGNEILLDDGPDYAITLISETGFNVELVNSYEVGILSIRRETPQVQETEFMPGGDFPANAFEDALDRLVMMQQEMDEILSRVVNIAKSDDGDMVLPNSLLRANRYFVFDEDGNASVSTDPGPGGAEFLENVEKFIDSSYSYFPGDKLIGWQVNRWDVDTVKTIATGTGTKPATLAACQLLSYT